ncbi:hypothetical protein THAOC_24543, partial [Thalassiosira oceanica]
QHYLPGEAIVFDVSLTNDRPADEWTRARLELGVDLTSNTGDLSVLSNGKSLSTPQEYILQGGEEVTTKILISKGQGNSLSFNPVRLFLRSACTADSYDPAIAHDIAWNQEIWEETEYLQRIIFTPPCPQIRWAGPFAEERQMVYSTDTLTALSDLVEVSIYNVDYTNGKLFDRSVLNEEAPESEQRLQKVVLVYRRFGEYDSPWVEAHLEDPVTRLSNPDMVEFANPGVEDDMGYATLQWNVEGIPDSRYLVKVMSNCTALENSHSTHNYFSTDAVEVVLDKTSPALFGAPFIQLSGSVDSVKQQVYRFIFTEPLYCEEPHVFHLAVTLSIGQNSRTFTHGSHGSGIFAKCSGEEIRYRFDDIELDEWYTAQTSAESTDLVIDVNFLLGGVSDLALNRADDFTFASSWAQVRRLCVNLMAAVPGIQFSYLHCGTAHRVSDNESKSQANTLTFPVSTFAILLIYST